MADPDSVQGGEMCLVEQGEEEFLDVLKDEVVGDGG